MLPSGGKRLHVSFKERAHYNALEGHSVARHHATNTPVSEFGGATSIIEHVVDFDLAKDSPPVVEIHCATSSDPRDDHAPVAEVALTVGKSAGNYRNALEPQTQLPMGKKGPSELKFRKEKT